MRCALLTVLLLGGAVVAALDAKTTTESKVKSDNGKVVTVTGCLEIGGGTSFLLSNITADDEQHTNTASTARGSYALSEREGLDLGPYIHQKVELTGVVIPPLTRGDKDDKIKIQEANNVGAENGRSRKPASTKTVKVPRTAATQFLVASVKALAPTCP
jgi:hypothetical protein